ncbi:hypothetical protein [Actinoplanes couchii]|uniref:Lipoprotein n=1 Tax=Actinoplanes couchii TaxID=403638 RepID=A0ABQ3XFR7_9ACTN|nr:hypothetical protein [Actinoplanes couchii]MDR6321694.1 hypothetical protein [Actinoplanes couchii]GID57350.1 hypothetical protein Aco03nite_057540 [Actinoplanes couchii]
MRTTGTAGLLFAVLSLAACDSAGPAPAAVGSAAPSTAVSPVVTASANGIEALEAAAILDRARETLRRAPSFRFTGTADGRTLDLRISGADARGTVLVGEERTEWLVTGGQRYLKADERFWATRFGDREGAIGRELVGDRWMLVPPAMDSRLIGKDFAVGALLDTTFAPDGTVRKQPAAGAVTVTDAGGSAVSVATTGEPYPVGWTGNGRTGSITEVGVPFPAITTPPEDEVFDLVTLVESGMLTEL